MDTSGTLMIFKNHFTVLVIKVPGLHFILSLTIYDGIS